MKDILFNQNNEIQIINGDIYIGNSDQQNVKFILEFSPGHSKQHPKIGVGLPTMLLSNLNGEMKAKIHTQVASDGYSVKKISTDQNGNIQIEI